MLVIFNFDFWQLLVQMIPKALSLSLKMYKAVILLSLLGVCVCLNDCVPGGTHFTFPVKKKMLGHRIGAKGKLYFSKIKWHSEMKLDLTCS